MNKNKLKLKWILGIHKVLPNYPSKEDLLFDIVDHLYQRDGLKDPFNKNLLKVVLGSVNFHNFSEKIEDYLEDLVKDNQLSKQETKSKILYTINKDNIPYLN